MNVPSTEAIVLILLSLAAYAMSAVLGWATSRMKDQAPRPMTMTTLTAGVALCLATVVLRLSQGHAVAASGFDIFSVLALLTGAVTVYLWAVNALGRAGLLLMPLAALWAAMAVALSGQAYHSFARDTWTIIHVVMAATSALAFAASAVAGWQYLRKYAQLRNKDPRMFEGPATSLERIERFLRHCLPLAFALVTATVVTGLIDALQQKTYFHKWVTHPKMVGAGVAWLLYTVALHAAYARRFRAREAAMLSIVGFVLLVIVLMAAMLFPQ